MTLAQLIIFPVSIISFLILLSFIVFFHEYGHFSVARLLGIRVDTFSIGFGKPLLRWTDRKGTEWRIATIPLGGYVKFFGDLNAASQPNPALAAEQEEAAEGPKPVTTQFPSADKQALAAGMTEEERRVCFHFKPVWARAMVVAAGPLANFLLAIVIFASLLMLFGRGTFPPVVGEVGENSAAQEAGIIPGDRIVSINGRAIEEFQDIIRHVQLSTGETLSIVVERDGQEVDLNAVPRKEERRDALGNRVEVGMLGVGSAGGIEFKRFGPVAAFSEAVQEVTGIITTTIKFIGRLVQGKESAEQLGGPVKMAKYAGQAASFGFSDRVQVDMSFSDRLQLSFATFINLAAFISVSIGFLNLLPIPVLDGGHLMYYGYEAVVGKPVGPKAQLVGYQIGLLVLVSFMVFVTWNDITGLITSAFSSNG